MSKETFEQQFISRFDLKVEGMNLPIMSVLRVNTLILETLLETAEFRQMHIDSIALKHEAMGPYILTVNESITIRLRIGKAKEAVHV